MSSIYMPLKPHCVILVAVNKLIELVYDNRTTGVSCFICMSSDLFSKLPATGTRLKQRVRNLCNCCLATGYFHVTTATIQRRLCGAPLQITSAPPKNTNSLVCFCSMGGHVDV